MATRKQAKLTREAILRGIGWKPLKMPGVPRDVVEAENRRMQDYLVHWTQGLAAHIEKVEATEARRQGPRKRAEAKPARAGRCNE